MKTNDPARVSLLTLAGFLACLTLAHANNIYVANWNTDEIYQFDQGGNRTTFAATAVSQPGDLAFDVYGNLYASIRVGNLIQKFDPQGHASVFASTGLKQPGSLAFDKNGNLYVANVFGNNILKFDPQGHGSIFSSMGAYNASVGLSFDSKGNLYGAFGNKNQILKFDANGVQSVFTTVPTSCYYLAFDKNDTLYAGSESGPIYKIYSPGNVVTFANCHVAGMAFDSSGSLYAVSNNNILKIDSSGNASLFATTPDFPNGIAVRPVPEPSSWAMLAVGFGALLGARRLCRCQPSTTH